MKIALSQNRIDEYLITGSLVIVIFLCGMFSFLLDNTLVIMAITASLLLGMLLFVKKVTPVHVLYTLCFGVSFLPYINLGIFPLSGVYVVAILFVGLTAVSLYSRDKPIHFPTPAKWMALFLGIGVMTILYAPDARGVVVSSVQFLLYLCIYVATVNILDQKKLVLRAIKYIIYGSIFPLFACVIQMLFSFSSLQAVVNVFYDSIWGKLFMGSNGLQRLGENAALLLNRGSNVGSTDQVLFRVFGTFEAPTVFGGYIMVVAVLAAALYIVQIGKKRIGFSGITNATIFGALVICLLLTWARSAWLAFFLAMAFIIVYKNETEIRIFTAKNFKLLSLVIFIPAVVFILLLFTGMPLATKVLTSIIPVNGIDASTAGRLFSIFFGIQFIIHNPIIGIGFGNFRYAHPTLNIDSSAATFASGHDRYLSVGVQMGLPGLFVFLMIFVLLIKQSIHLVKAPVNTFYHTLGITFMAFWIGFLVVSLFAGSIIHPRSMTLMWILAGIQTATYYLYRNEQPQKNTVYRLEAAHKH